MAPRYLISLALALVSMLILAFPVSTVEAGGVPTKGLFETTIKWAQKDQHGYWISNWQARSSIDTVVTVYSYFKVASSSGFERTITKTGVSANFDGSTSHIYSLRSIQLMKPGMGRSFFGSSWNVYNCQPGPTIGYERQGDTITGRIVNTTSKVLYATDNNGKNWYKLNPGQVVKRQLKPQPDQYLSVFTERRHEPAFGCADLLVVNTY